MTSFKEENKKKDIEEIDLEDLDEKNNSNQQNNSNEMNNIESESKKEKSLDRNEIGNLKDNTKSIDDIDNENKEILSNEVTDEKNNEEKTEKSKDEDGKDNKVKNKEIKNKSEINNSQENSGNQNHDNNNNKSDTKLKDEFNDNIEKEKKNKNQNMIKDTLSPSYSKISYQPSEYRSILQNIELNESDKLLLEKYSNCKSSSYKINNNDLCNNLSFIKRLTYNYQNPEEPKTINYLSKYKYNTIEASPKQYLNNNYITNSKTLLEYENEKPKTYLERNNLIVNDIGKNFNFSWDNIDYKADIKIGRNNSEKILFNNSPFERDIINLYKSNKNDDNQCLIKSLKRDFSNKNNLKKENEDFKLNFTYSFNISRNPDKNRNLLSNTSLTNYHIPHTQSSIMNKYMPNYSIFDFHRYMNYKSNSTSIPNINKYNKEFYNYENKSITNNYHQNMNNNDTRFINNNNNSNYNVNADNNNYKCVLNYEYKNLNNDNINSIIHNTNKSLDKNNNKINKENQNNMNKSNQSIQGNENPFINKITNPKRFSSNSLSIPKYNSKKYKSLLFDDDKKDGFISDNKNSAKNFNNKLFQPNQNYPFQNNLNKNQNYDFITRNKIGEAFRNDKKEDKKISSPSDFYFNTLNQKYIPKTQIVGRNSRPQFLRTYQIDENKDMNNKKLLFYFSTIRRDLIDKNKRKSINEF